MEVPPRRADTNELEIAINRDHPHFQRIVEHAVEQPNMAIYMLAKSLLLTGNTAVDDLPLISAAQASVPEVLEDHRG